MLAKALVDAPLANSRASQRHCSSVRSVEETDGLVLEGCNTGLLNVKAGGKSMSTLEDGFDSTDGPGDVSCVCGVAVCDCNGADLVSGERKRELSLW